MDHLLVNSFVLEHIASRCDSPTYGFFWQQFDQNWTAAIIISVLVKSTSKNCAITDWKFNSPTWKKFPHFPVFFLFEDVPYPLGHRANVVLYLTWVWFQDVNMRPQGNRCHIFNYATDPNILDPLNAYCFHRDFPQGFWQECLWTNLAQSSIWSKTNLWNRDVCCAINIDFRRNMFATRLFPRFSKEPRFLWNLILI